MRFFIQIYVALLVCLLAISGCKQRPAHAVPSSSAIDSLVPRYSHSFRVDYYADHKVVRVFNDKTNELLATYLLYRTNTHNAVAASSGTVIDASVHRVACLSTTHIGAMLLLHTQTCIVAAANKDLIYDDTLRSNIDAGIIHNAGHDYQPDYEAIVQARPDILFTDGEDAGSSQIVAKLKNLGIKLVASRDYFEQEPLARAEWIKFFAAFVDKEQTADSIFKSVEKDYKEIKANAGHAAIHPSVFCNLPYNGVWYMPCGQNYAAKVVTDAGGDFLWEKEKPINGLNLTLNFEQVYSKAAKADFWINQNMLTSKEQVLKTDPKFSLFDAVKKGNIYNGTKRRTAAGGMDIWETGAFLPNIVLRDLVAIFECKTNDDNNLYYYQRLK